MIADRLLLLLVLFIGGAVLYLKFRRDPSQNPVTEEEDIYGLPYLVTGVKNSITATLQTDYTRMRLNREQVERERQRKIALEQAKNECAYGDAGAKEEMVKYIKDILPAKFGITEEVIDRVIPFDNPVRLTPQDKWEILLILYRKVHGREALSKLISNNHLDAPLGSGGSVRYEITKDRINTCFRRHSNQVDAMTFSDKLAVVSQRVYQSFLGHGAVDLIQDMALDGFSAGVSGVPTQFYLYGEDTNYGAEEGELPLTDYNSIWILFHGHQVQLSFLGFGSTEELIRVTSDIYKYNDPGTMSANVGKMVSKLKDGSRVTACRPPFAESWGFWVRKLDGAQRLSLDTMYHAEHMERLLEACHWIMRGFQNTAITGSQGTGKTSLLMALIQFFPTTYTIRVQELVGELRLRNIYRKRNVMSFEETQTVSAQDGINFGKKTDGTLNIFGEVASAEVATLAMQTGQVGSLGTFFTHHAETAWDLVTALAKNMIEAGGYTDQKMMEETVASILNVNIHLMKQLSGDRQIERITEIVPHVAEPYPETSDEAMIEFFRRSTDRPTFDTYNLLEFHDGAYYYTNKMTDAMRKRIHKNLSSEESSQFSAFLVEMDREVEEYRENPGA